MRIQYQNQITEPVRIGDTVVQFVDGISEDVSDEVGNKFLAILSYSKVNAPVDVVPETIISGEVAGFVIETQPESAPKPNRRKPKK